MSARRKIIMKAMQGDPVKYTGSPLPPKPVNLNDQVLMGAWSDDDPEVCLNCEMPPERCHGTDECYLRHKEKKDKMKIELTVKEIDLILDVMNDWYIEWADTIGRRQKDRDIENLARKLDDYKENENADCH